MGRIKDLNSALPAENDAFVFDGSNGTKKLSYAEFKQKLIDDGFGSGSSEAVVLTQAEYDALPDEVKDSDTIFFISDAPFESSNIVPCTRAEYNAMSTATKMDGRFYYVTDDAEVDTSLIVDNLTTDDAGYALSAKQGKVLNDSLLTPSSASGTQITVNSSYVSSSNLRWNRIGNVIAVSGWFRLSVVPAADVNIFKVPSSYHESVVFGYDQNAKNAVCLQLMTSGDVRCVYSNFVVGNYINVGFTYITT